MVHLEVVRIANLRCRHAVQHTAGLLGGKQRALKRPRAGSGDLALQVVHAVGRVKEQRAAAAGVDLDVEHAARRGLGRCTCNNLLSAG